jgi:DNA-binding CsgD family transcriptional regulator
MIPIFTLVDKYKLTPRELDIYTYLRQGYGLSYIADVFSISINTAKNHKHAIFEKLKVKNISELIIKEK